MDTASAPTSDPVDAFLTDWFRTDGSEPANDQLLCS
jgi:hypothetical protein